MRLAVFHVFLLVLAVSLPGCDSTAKPKGGNSNNNALKICMHFPEGKYEMKVLVETDIDSALGEDSTKTTENQEYFYEITAGKPEQDGSQEIVMECTRWINSQDIGGYKTEFDTKEGKQIPFRTRSKAQLIGMKMTVLINSEGRIVQSRGIDEYLTALAEKENLEKDRVLLAKFHLNDDRMYANALAAVTLLLPHHPVEPGGTWKPHVFPPSRLADRPSK